ncbi:hypothetical protein ACFV1T_09420, partial [Streptomyces vinaceus]
LSFVGRRDHARSGGLCFVYKPPRGALGHPETARRLEGVLERCHPTNRVRVAEELARARDGRGPTLFDVLTEIIDARAPGALRLR